MKRRVVLVEKGAEPLQDGLDRGRHFAEVWPKKQCLPALVETYEGGYMSTTAEITAYVWRDGLEGPANTSVLSTSGMSKNES
jgi:hypothetical protein